MRSNEEFRKLIDDKHKSLIQNRKQNKKMMVGLLSCLAVCVLVLTVFLSNSEYMKIWLADSNGGDSDNSTNEIPITPESDKDSLQNEHNHSNTPSYDDISSDESFDIQSSEDISDEPIISDPDTSSIPNTSIPEESESESSEEISDDTSDKQPEDMSDDIADTPNPYPPFTNMEYEIVPDDFPNITKTENLMQYLTPTKKPDEPSDESPDVPSDESPDVPSDAPSDDVGDDDVGEESPETVPSDKPDPFDDTETQYGIADFGFELFKNTYTSNQNNLLSPTATLYSLAMLTNGAHGNTQDQLVDTLCGTSLDRMNEYLCEYRTLLGKGYKSNINLESAVWYDSSVTVDKNFLQTNCDYYGMDAFKTIFGTQDALDSANGWIEEKSNGYINEIIDNFDTESTAFITNTLYFEASWVTKLYPDNDHNTFTNAFGEEKNVEMMTSYSRYDFRYLENDNCTGFTYSCDSGYYTGYSFVALLPNEEITISELINSLNSETYFELMNNSTRKVIKISMPKFETDAEIELSDALKSIGITDTFDAEKADFSRMGICENNNLFLDNVTQKVTLSVHQDGTLNAKEAYPSYSQINKFDVSINLNRPFVYMFIDNTTKLPMFIGTVEDFE